MCDRTGLVSLGVTVRTTTIVSIHNNRHINAAPGSFKARAEDEGRACSEGQGGGCLLNPSGSCAAGNTSSVQL